MSVFMSLYEEETVHMVITSLPNLQFLNGIEIQRKEEKAAEAATEEGKNLDGSASPNRQRQFEMPLE